MRLSAAFFRIDPLARKRLRRFRETRQAWYSSILLGALFLVSLCSELICNSRPLAVRHAGRWYFPILRFHPEDTFLHNGNAAEADYLKLRRDREFRENGGRLYFTLDTDDPYRIVPQQELRPFLRVQCRLSARPGVASVTVDGDLNILDALGLDSFGVTAAPARLPDLLAPSPELRREIRARLASAEARPRFAQERPGLLGRPAAEIVLAARQPRRRIPRRLRITIRETRRDGRPALQKGWILPGRPLEGQKAFRRLPEDARKAVREILPGLDDRSPDAGADLPGNLRLDLHRETGRYPFRPVPGHPLGIDDAGRDILARILYGLRASLLFGLILVGCSMVLGTAAGLLQGYLGGWVDITAQRAVEIWSALPFLYVVILLGSIYGTSFPLLIFCYALFNWIGISYYMRAEMLRLRKMPFVEAARCLGLPGWKIAWRHILPNAMVPLITFFPFSLVGAIGSLAALDYLGFGLPPPTPSLGQLLQQAQSQRWAYWLILYPSLALFLIMLLGVFIGEGFRNAYDPRRQNRLR